MDENKVAREVAEGEIGRWLDCKKVSNKKRESNRSSIDSLVDAVVEGLLVVQEDGSLIHTLKFPTDGESPLESLKYKLRLKVGDIHSYMKGIKADDADGRVAAYVAALIGKPLKLVQALDSEDYSISQAVAVFFI